MFQGLSSNQAQERLGIHGYNELPSAQSKSIWRIVLEVLKEPMFILLISCGALYMILGDYKEGAILMSTISVIIFITFYQYQKTEKALEALRELSSPRALVIRDGKEFRVAGREVVPGDLIILNEGDRIVADAKLIEGINLTIDESLLTGESVPVSRSPGMNGPHDQVHVFSGTLIVRGKGLAEVIATGSNTQFGKIGTSLQSIEQDQTRLQKEMKILIRNLFIIGAVLSIGVVLAFYFTRGDFVRSLLSGLAAAMAILPEEFPVVLTIFLALGAWRLSKKNVLTRKPSAIETLGSATVLCSDKTGTITQNKMEVGALFDGKQLFKGNIFLEDQEQITDIVIAAHRASQIDSIDPMERAIGTAYKKLNLQKGSEEKLVKEYPFSHELLAMTRVMKNEPEDPISVSAKGAPETIFTLCKMNEEEKKRNLEMVDLMGADGFRVIAVASAKHDVSSLPETQHGFDFNFLGLIGLEDPIRLEVADAIRECKNAGIKVIMITGDFPATAKSIAKKIGLDQEIISGDELKDMDDDALRKRIVHTTVFARVKPDQKLRIVQALKANNEIVAMTGDGVNDAPALKAAHIGIAMGNKGTDVAREASSLVLLDDNFASIVSAIRSGRRIFDNLQKAMTYILAIHIPIIGLALLPAIFTSLPLLLLPLHIVFMELIIDPVCSIAFESEQEEKRIMSRPPRDPNEQFFGAKRILSSIFEGILLLAMVLSVYFLSVSEGHTEGEVRAIAFSSLIIGNIFLILTNLSKTRSFIAVIAERNISTVLILTSAMILLLLIISIPSLQHIFSFEFPGYHHFIPAFIGSFTMLMILELVKYFNYRNGR